MSAFKLFTPRLLLRPFELRDAAGFYQMNADLEVIRYTGDLPFASVQAAEDFIRAYDHYTQYGYGRWAIERLDNGVFLGFCGLKYHPEAQEIDLGYRLIREHWGQGYATEAALASLRYAFDELMLGKVIGRVDQENTASVRVLEKIGMKKVRPIDFDGRPGYLYELVKEKYAAYFFGK